MIFIPKQFSDADPLRARILYVLSVMHKGSANEIAMELVELQGIASEGGVSDIIMDTESELMKMCDEGIVVEIKEHRQKKRYGMVEVTEGKIDE